MEWKEEDENVPEEIRRAIVISLCITMGLFYLMFYLLCDAYFHHSLEHGCESALDYSRRHCTLDIQFKPSRFRQSAPILHLVMWSVGSPRDLHGSRLAVPTSQLRHLTVRRTYRWEMQQNLGTCKQEVDLLQGQFSCLGIEKVNNRYETSIKYAEIDICIMTD